MIGPALAIASTAASLFGGKKKGTGTPQMQQNSGGYNALPPQAQQAYQNYFNQLNGLGANPINNNYLAQAQAPRGPFDSQELYKLQQATPDRGVRQLGVLEPFNQYQQNALMQMGNPDFSQNGLAQYMNPYQEMVQNRAEQSANRSFDTAKNDIMSKYGNRGNFASNSRLNDLLAQVEEGRGRALGDISANLGYQGYNEALGLRDRSLADMFRSGSAIQNQNQQQLGLAGGQSLAMNNPAYGMAQAYMQLLQGMPINSSSGLGRGPVAERPNMLSRLGGAGQSMNFANMNFGGF